MNTCSFKISCVSPPQSKGIRCDDGCVIARLVCWGMEPEKCRVNCTRNGNATVPLKGRHQPAPYTSNGNTHG